MLSLKGNAGTKPNLKATINGNAIPTVESVTYLVVTFSRYEQWVTHVEESVCVCVSFFVRKRRKLSTPVEFIHKFTEACVFPSIFPGRLKHDFDLFKRSIYLTSHICDYLKNLVCERHIKAPSNFAVRIIEGNQDLS